MRTEADQIYRLRWNSDSSAELNLSEAFRDIRDNSELFDVTLGTAVANGVSKILRAHRLILSAYSPAFKEMFRHQSKHSEPFVFLKGVSYLELSNLLDFMYNGEVNVTKANLNTFLALAEDLQIKGLAKGNTFNQRPKQQTKSAVKPRIFAKDTGRNVATKYESVSQYLKKEERVDLSDDNMMDDWGQSQIKEEPQSSQEKLSSKYASKPRTDSLQDNNDDEEPDVPVMEGEVGVVEDFIRNMSKHLYTGNQKRSVSKCRICLRELRRDKIKQHIRGTHPTYLVAAIPREELEVSSSNGAMDESITDDGNNNYEYSYVE